MSFDESDNTFCDFYFLNAAQYYGQLRTVFLFVLKVVVRPKVCGCV